MGSTSVFRSHEGASGDSSDLWQRCLDAMEQSLPRPAFETCLRGSVGTVAAPGRMHVLMPHGYAFEQILGRHRSLIEAARCEMRALTQQDWHVEFTAPSREEEEARAAAPMIAAPATPAPTAARRMAPPAETAEAPVLRRGARTTASLSDDPRFTFERLVTGPTNQLAVQAARQAAETPGRTFNPLVIYGEVGLGKTHLLQALKHLMSGARPRARVVYTSSETFTNELVEAFQERRVPAFRKKYRQVDLLMVDDIEFLVGKERIQEEFYHTFEQIAASGRQVILTCDRPPQLLTQLQERLCSRLSSGLIADIQAPTFEMRREILAQRSRESNAAVADEVIEYIAERFSGSVRNLEGALVRVLAVANASGDRVVRIGLAQRALEPLSPTRPSRQRRVTLHDILEKVSHYYHVEVDDLIGARRDRRFSTPRHIAMYLAQELMRMRCREISEAFGGRDYSTVTHAIKKIVAQREQPNIKNDLSTIASLLEG